MESFPELKDIGLDEHEIKVYLSCLARQGLTAKEIAEQADLIRTTAYGVINSLMKKGLLSTVDKEGIKTFSSIEPRELISKLEEKKENLRTIIPRLEKYRTAPHQRYRVEVFEGMAGIKTLTNDIISRPDEVVRVIGAGQKWLQFSNIFTSIYYRKKKEMHVHTKTILADTDEERQFVRKKRFVNSEIRLLPQAHFGNDAIYIYHDKVSFVHYSEEQPRGFLVQDAQYHKFQTAIFDRLWNISHR